MFKFIKTEMAKKWEEEGYNFFPTRATTRSSGYDLCVCIDEEKIVLTPQEVVKIPTGIKLWIGSDSLYEDADIPITFAGILLPRSSCPGFVLTNTIGLIDSDYQGEIFVKVRNITNDIITLIRGERFAQLVIVPTATPHLIEVDVFNKVTERNEGGFGHTGR